MAKLLACRLCLATDVKLFDMNREGLVDLYEMLLGTQILENDNLPEAICAICSTLLLKYSSFRERCNNSQALLKCVYWRKAAITLEDIQGFDREYHNLKLPLALKLLTSQIDIVTNIQIGIFERPDNVIKIENDSDHNRDDTVPDDHPHLAEQENLEANQSFFEQNGVNDKDLSLLTNSDDEPLSKSIVPRSTTPINVTERDSDSESEKSSTSEDFVVNKNVLMPNDKNVKHELSSLDSQFHIIVLTKEQQKAELLARKKTDNYLNSSHKCEQCYKGFITQTTYLNHMQSHDPSSGAFVCDICGMRRPTENLARAHLMQTHQYDYVCRLCGQVLKTRNRAREHARWHQGHLYPCSTCGLSFAKPTSLLSHMRMRHVTAGSEGASAHECSACGDVFVTPLGLSMHKKRAHPVTKTEPGAKADGIAGVREKRACIICGVRFRNAASLRRHVAQARCSIAETHNDDRKCPECDETFKDLAALRRHVLGRHPPQVHCPQCNRIFGSERSMESHRRHAHTAGPAVPRPSLCCERCGRLYKTKLALRRHHRVHTGEKPYSCSHCPKRFASKDLLQIHTRTHTGERPFACSSCPRAFRHKSALNRHTRVHTGARPYACAHCPRSFSQSNSCKLHVRTVHLKLPPPYKRRADPVPLTADETSI